MFALLNSMREDLFQLITATAVTAGTWHYFLRKGSLARVRGGRETYLLVAVFTLGGLIRHGHASWAGSTPRSPAPAFIGFAAQAKLDRFASAGVSALHTLTFIFNPGDVTGAQGIDV